MSSKILLEMDYQPFHSSIRTQSRIKSDMSKISIKRKMSRIRRRLIDRYAIRVWTAWERELISTSPSYCGFRNDCKGLPTSFESQVVSCPELPYIVRSRSNRLSHVSNSRSIVFIQEVTATIRSCILKGKWTASLRYLKTTRDTP